MIKKSSKNSTSKQNFYFAILEELKVNTNLLRIQRKLSISKQQLNYYLRGLKKKGFIYKKGKGWWEVTEKSKNATQYSNFFDKDFIRGHAYVWNIELLKEIKDWNKRIEILEKKGINYKLVGNLKNIPRIKVLGRKIWLCNNHIRIFDIKDSSYYGETAIESSNMALNELYLIVGALENKLGVLLKPFKFSYRKEHYALIKNDLAIDQNQKGVIWRLKDNEGEWLLIDDSLEQGGELENVGKKAFKTNILLQKWWNDMKDTDFKVTPTFLMEMMNGIQGNQVIFDKNMQSHIKAVQQLGNSAKANEVTVGLLADEVIKLRKVIEELKK